MSLKAVIFDLDGVIVDSAKYHFRAWSKMATKVGLVFNEEDNERLKGVSRTDSLDIILAINNLEFSDTEKTRLLEYKNELYLEYVSLVDKSEILAGAAELIDDLRKNGLKVALGSSSKNGRLLLRQMDLISKFDVIVDGTNITRSKPDPEVFLLGANQLGLAPKRCLVVEDAASGIQAAIQGGFRSLGVGEKSILGAAEHVLPGLAGVDVSRLESLYP